VKSVYSHYFASGIYLDTFLHAQGPSPSFDASHAWSESRQLNFEIFDLPAASQKNAGGNWWFKDSQGCLLVRRRATYRDFKIVVLELVDFRKKVVNVL
jgi:hypothetical protein